MRAAPSCGRRRVIRAAAWTACHIDQVRFVRPRRARRARRTAGVPPGVSAVVASRASSASSRHLGGVDRVAEQPAQREVGAAQSRREDRVDRSRASTRAGCTWRRGRGLKLTNVAVVTPAVTAPIGAEREAKYGIRPGTQSGGDELLLGLGREVDHRVQGIGGAVRAPGEFAHRPTLEGLSDRRPEAVAGQPRRLDARRAVRTPRVAAHREARRPTSTARRRACRPAWRTSSGGRASTTGSSVIASSSTRRGEHRRDRCVRVVEMGAWHARAVVCRTSTGAPSPRRAPSSAIIVRSGSSLTNAAPDSDHVRDANPAATAITGS